MQKEVLESLKKATIQIYAHISLSNLYLIMNNEVLYEEWTSNYYTVKKGHFSEDEPELEENP